MNTKRFFEQIVIDGQQVDLGEFIMGVQNDPTMTVTHLNGNTMDNRRANLQIIPVRLLATLGEGINTQGRA